MRQDDPAATIATIAATATKPGPYEEENEMRYSRRKAALREIQAILDRYDERNPIAWDTWDTCCAWSRSYLADGQEHNLQEILDAAHEESMLSGIYLDPYFVQQAVEYLSGEK